MCDLMLKQKTCPLRPNGCNLGMNERWALENWWLENNDTRHVQERSPCLMKKMHVCLFSKASSGKRLLNRDVCLTHISSPSIKMHELCICSKRTAGWGSVCMYDLYEAYTCNWKSMLNQYHIIYHFFAVTASSNTFYKKYWKRLSSCYSKVYFQHDLSCWKYTYYELIKDQPSWIHKVQIKKKHNMKERSLHKIKTAIAHSVKEVTQTHMLTNAFTLCAKAYMTVHVNGIPSLWNIRTQNRVKVSDEYMVDMVAKESKAL